ncbi:hypothetical protein J2797_006240 [Paraburkholderia terricola]|uniref:hypothetical protein n=1 Tax=Paraburkholderia terricola TaxID=169427 RepID=UPI0028549F3C|nr:hypothetical protein [Paraburkholderia terricola]MDR6496313.1 hypothetical protein [Paraburkholderia terricola]
MTSSAIPQPGARPMGFFKPRIGFGDVMDTGLNQWTENRTRFAANGLLARIFVDMHAMSVQHGKGPPYEPLLLSRHATRLGDLMEKCMALRKDIRELEILAMKAATDYELFQSTSKLEEELEILRLQADSKTSEMSGFLDATREFGGESIEKGLSKISDGRGNALKKDLQACDRMKDLIGQRWASLRKYQEDYHARFSEPGNAHNYGQRAEFLLEVLQVLMQEALDRASALSGGVSVIYRSHLEATPTTLTLANLDEFVKWALTALRQLGRAADQEETTEIVVPLVQPWFKTALPLVTAEAFENALRGGTDKPVIIAFEFPDNGVLNSLVRTRGIGVSFGNAFNIGDSGIDRNQTADSFTRLFVKVRTPYQRDANGNAYSRPEVLLGNVCLHGSGRVVAMADGAAVENLCPFGKWEIEIHPLVVWKDNHLRAVDSVQNSDKIRDLKLTLRIFTPNGSVPFSSASAISDEAHHE